MKKKPASGGGESCPLWYISFADMVSLLMAFFVMLASLSSASNTDDSKLRQFLKSLQEALKFPVTISVDETSPEELLARLEQMSMKNFQHDGGGKDEGNGRPGTQNTIKRTREGIEFTIGGQLGFDAGSTDLRDEAKAALAEIHEYIRGENNKVEIRGHATRLEGGARDEHQLAYARACSVADYLTSLGLRPERLRRVDCGSSEPLVLHAYDEQTKRANRRVEIIVTQALVQEFQGIDGELSAPPQAAGPRSPTTQGGQDQPRISGVSVNEGN
ncbi:MAG: OmpA family protein [Phycisphaerae bacterium]|nr:OmpA family protein [Phycisphaerae bacterium]